MTVTYQTYSSNDELAKRSTRGEPRRAAAAGGEDLRPDRARRTTSCASSTSRTSSQPLDAATSCRTSKNLDPEFRDEGFDPGNTYTVPWATGTTGIAYDTTVFEGPPDWNVFADAAHKGKMTVLDEMRDAFGAALLSLGRGPEHDPQQDDRRRRATS